MQHAQASAPSRRRARQAVKRSRTIRFDLTEAEFGEIRAAADQAGLAAADLEPRSGYLLELNVSSGSVPPTPAQVDLLRD